MEFGSKLSTKLASLFAVMYLICLGNERQDTHLEQIMYCLFLPDLNDSSGENVT